MRLKKVFFVFKIDQNALIRRRTHTHTRGRIFQGPVQRFSIESGTTGDAARGRQRGTSRVRPKRAGLARRVAGERPRRRPHSQRSLARGQRRRAFSIRRLLRRGLSLPVVRLVLLSRRPPPRWEPPKKPPLRLVSNAPLKTEGPGFGVASLGDACVRDGATPSQDRVLLIFADFVFSFQNCPTYPSVRVRGCL